MTTVLKKDSSVLDEFEIPEHLGGIVEDLKKEQSTLSQAIAQTKSESQVRKQDESTKVFNLRQHQMELKLAELEEKKIQTEKELQTILQQKNSTLHADLRKLAQYILQETKKIDSKFSSVTGLRNELQNIFEQSLEDRKKNRELLEEQKTNLLGLGELIRDTSKLLQGDFHSLTSEIERLQLEKQEELRKLSSLKEEVSYHQGLVEEIQIRKKDLKDIEHKISLGEKNALSFARLEDELTALRNEAEKFRHENANLQAKNTKLQHEEFHGLENLSRLKLQDKHIEHVLAGKKDQLQILEGQVFEVRKRIEERKNEEHELETRILHRRDELQIVQNEISRLEAEKHAREAILSESRDLFEEKKTFFANELTAIQNLNSSRTSELEAKLEKRRLLWEEEFSTYTEARKAELRAELERQDKADLEDIRRKKNDLLIEIVRIMGSILSSDGFSSTEERTQKAHKEVEKSFEIVFGKTRRWKFW